MGQLENVVGGLYGCIQQTIPGSWRTSAEITTERRDNTNLRKDSLLTANVALYRREGQEEILYFGDREANPFFNNTAEAVKQFMNHPGVHTYRLTEKEIAAVLKSVRSGKTLRVKLSELDLISHGIHELIFIVNPKRYDALLNPMQRALMERVYGSGSDFPKNMEMFGQKDIRPIIYLFNPNYLKDRPTNEGVAAVCWLGGMLWGGNSNFFANGYMRDYNFTLRAVRKESSVRR